LLTAGLPVVDLRWSPRYTDAGRDSAWRQAVLVTPSVALAVMRLRRVVDRLRPDIVHAHTRKSQLIAAAASVGSDVPVIWHLRDDVPGRPVLRRALRLGISQAAHAVALSRWQVDGYISSGLVPRSRQIGIVPSSVDAADLGTLATPWLDGRREPVIGFIGQIVAWKAPHLLVDAAECLVDRPDLGFAIIGDVWFPQSDAGYGSWLERRIAGSPARDRIRRLGTRSPREAFDEIDVLAHTSAEPEPFGRVLVEAMVARRPVVAFRRGSVPEILDDTTGNLADGMDGPALADAIRSATRDPQRARVQADLAAASADRFSPARVAAAMDAAYRVVLG
jgi:glycosyltransferase involved in cell wall biosynthesis